MLGFRKLFKGCGDENHGLGFDDFLIAMDASELAQEIDGAAEAVLSAIDNIEEPNLVTALENDFESVSQLHEALNALSRLMRTDFLIVLNLELPQMVQGDND